VELLREIVPLALRASVALLILAVGLDSTMHEATWVLRRRGLLARSLLAFAVAVPLLAALLVAALPLDLPVKIGILLMAVSPLPPFMPAREIKLGGSRRYVYGLLVAVSLAAIVLVPATVALLGRAFGDEASISPGPVLRLILVSLIIPLAVGMLIRHLAPAAGRRAAPGVTMVANIVLLLSVLPIVVDELPALLHLIGNGTVVAMAVVVLGALLAGHLSGGPEPQDRAVLAIACTTRHPGVALLIAHANFSGTGVKAAILLFLIVGVVVSLPYQVWYKRHALAVH
jgi:BASS family bile acid:Na+ symporter